jgi:hypothetical protein
MHEDEGDTRDRDEDEEGHEEDFFRQYASQVSRAFALSKTARSKSRAFDALNQAHASRV